MVSRVFTYPCRQECPQLGNTDSNHRAPERGLHLEKNDAEGYGTRVESFDVYSLHSACMSSSSILIERENDEMVRVYVFKTYYSGRNTEVSYAVRLGLCQVSNNPR